MATAKRKAVTEDRPNKKAKSTRAESEAKPTKKSKLATDDSSERRPISRSLLQQEERAFPRGGASVLTPIEQKQIKAQAERDVLFEQQTGKAVVHGGDEDELFDQEIAAAPVKRKQKNDKSKKDLPKAVDAPALKVHGLSYKNITVGTTVLGYVTAVTTRDVELAFANNLSGYIPITAVSDRMNARIAKLLDEDDEVEDEEDHQDINLKELFYVGQWLRALVTATTSESADGSGKSKRHIELSVNPSQVNGGLDNVGVALNSMLQASVRSEEDHGIVMDLGLASPDVRGFISKRDFGTVYKADKVHEGQVMLCLVTGKASSGNVINLIPGAIPRSAVAEGKQGPIVSDAPTLEGFQAGTAVEVLITGNAPSGVVGKVMGLLNVSADLVHCGAGLTGDQIAKKFKVGSKARGRITWTTPNDDGSRRVAVSFLDHMLTLPPPSTKLPVNASANLRSQSRVLENHEPLSSIVDAASVTHVIPNRGLYMKLLIPGSKVDAKAFAHISQISDNHVGNLSVTDGKYRVDSTHRVRIISYNPVDNIYYVALKPSILEQQFLRLEDLTVGEAVKGNVERLILGAKGISGILVKLSDSITGLVPEMHLSDTHLEHPERKFKEGYPVKGRILSVDVDKKQVRLTLKKTLVNDDARSQIWKDYAELKPGMESKGTIVSIMRTGAAVQFFGNVRAWLPVAEMSDTFIENPEKHFRTGQTMNVTILSVDSESHQMKVSCKDSNIFDAEMEKAWNEIEGGQIVTGTVTEKSPEGVMIDLGNGLRGLIRVGHISDTATSNPEKALKKVHIGKALGELVILHKLERSRHVLLTRKASMLEDAKTGSLPRSYHSLFAGQRVNGFVRNVTPEGVYTEFAGGVVGLLPKIHVAPEMMGKTSFGLVKDQSLSGWISSVDMARERFSLSMREQTQNAASIAQPVPVLTIDHPVDPSITSLEDFSLGKLTKARITSVKGSQLNVRLADGIPGRVDASEAFDSWDEFKNKKFPLQKFKPNEVIDVKILGIHDARNHRYLPISHRSSGLPVFELSAKKSRRENGDESGLTMVSLHVGSQYLAFVNNHGDNYVWVNISPNVRGRIALMDLSDDAGQLQNLEKNFPVGCAVRVTVKGVNAPLNRLDLVARTGGAAEVTLQSVSKGMVLTARVTKVTERAVIVQLSDALSAPVPMVEISDDYDNINFGQYNKNDIIRVCVLDVDIPNKKVYLTIRPSRVLSSSLPVKDVQIASYNQLKTGDVLRGFVKHLADKGIYVSLGAKVDAFVRISDLSDKYVKDWKTIVQVDELVKGRILSVDADAKHALMSLKKSVVDKAYVAPVTINDLETGMIVTGKVRKVEDFGAFIDIDNTQPRLSGLCHRSEVAAKRIEDVRKIYSAGDAVKAKVLSVNSKDRKISLGLKASYFEEGEEEEEEGTDEIMSGGEVDSSADEDISGEDDGVEIAGGSDLGAIEDTEDEEEESDPENNADEALKSTMGLKTSGFDWNGAGDVVMADGEISDSEPEKATTKKRKRTKPEIKTDLTGDLDKHGARSVDDFERVLLGQPNDSGLWIQFMAFQLQLSEIQRAREIAERALRTIHIRELDEKANIWIAYLNLEVEYGDDERVEEVFKEACQVQDALEMHEKLASIYIDSGKHGKADTMFERIVGNKAFRASPGAWFNYASFLMDTRKESARARALLPRALQSIPTNEHRSLTARFAGLEFRSPYGDPERGRTIFEGLVAEYPKWSSGWDMFVDLERARLNSAGSEQDQAEAREKVRALHERIVSQKMKKRRARFVFKRWLEFEQKEGDQKSAERVQALAKEYVERMQAQSGGDDGDAE